MKKKKEDVIVLSVWTGEKHEYFFLNEILSYRNIKKGFKVFSQGCYIPNPKKYLTKK